MALTFGFRKPKEEKVEKYPNLPVLTYLGGEGVSKFALNTEAAKQLGYDSEQVTGKMVSFGPKEDTLFLANTTGAETPNQSKVNLDNSFANAKLKERLEKSDAFKGTEITEGSEFLMNIHNDEDYPYAVIVNLSPKDALGTDGISLEEDELSMSQKGLSSKEEKAEEVEVISAEQAEFESHAGEGAGIDESTKGSENSFE